MNFMPSSFTKWMVVCLWVVFAPLLQGEEKLFCPLDDRIWKIGFETQTDQEKIIELVLQNEEITNWNELFTIQKFEGVPVSASEFIAILEKTSKQNLPEHESLRFQFLKHQSTNIFESSFISDQSKNSSFSVSNEYNIGRVLKGKSALYYLRYSTKDGKLFEQNKEAWADRLELAYVASQQRKDLPGRWFTFTAKGVYDQGEPLMFQSPYQFIENHKIGFSLSIPKDWSVDKPLRSSVSPDASSLDYIDALYFSNAQIEGKIAFLDSINYQESHKEAVHYLVLYKKQHPQAKLVGKGKIQTILGQEGYYLILSNGEKKGWINFFRKANRIYYLELWTDRNQFEALKSDLEKIILNFQILSSPSGPLGPV